MNEDIKQQEPQGNGVLPCVSGWASYPENKPPYDVYLLVEFINIHGHHVHSVAVLQSIAQHNFENSPYYDRWFVFPSFGHELTNKVVAWAFIQPYR